MYVEVNLMNSEAIFSCENKLILRALAVLSGRMLEGPRVRAPPASLRCGL